jgi:excisionase family DNA binding protein
MGKRGMQGSKKICIMFVMGGKQNLIMLESNSVYTTSEAATILAVQPKTVTRYIERGLIAAQKKGRDYLIGQDELERFKQERRGRGKPAKRSNV